MGGRHSEKDLERHCIADIKSLVQITWSVETLATIGLADATHKVGLTVLHCLKLYLLARKSRVKCICYIKCAGDKRFYNLFHHR